LNFKFVIGALFAGLANSAITVPWVLLYLSRSPHWLSLARSEIHSVLKKHSPSSHSHSTTTTTLTALSLLPIEVWESSFPVLDLCLKESIRLHVTGTGYRRNVSGHPIPTGVGNEVIPNGALVAYHFNDIHRDESVYPEAEKWDPGRYLEGRKEDRKKERAYIGWGAGMHPCLGMRVCLPFPLKFHYPCPDLLWEERR
jgi:cytochrome P450